MNYSAACLSGSGSGMDAGELVGLAVRHSMTVIHSVGQSFVSLQSVCRFLALESLTDT